MSVKNSLKRFLAHIQKILCCQIPSRYRNSVKFPHPVGIVIGDGVQIGHDVRIYQNVTIGRIENAADSAYPTLEHGVIVYAGAVIAGAVTIGQEAVIGANALITRDVPAGCIAVGYNDIRPRTSLKPREC